MMAIWRRFPLRAVRTPETAEAANTANTKDVEFDATVVVSSKETNLRIGMTARADIITEQKDNVFAVLHMMLFLQRRMAARLCIRSKRRRMEVWLRKQFQSHWG